MIKTAAIIPKHVHLRVSEHEPIRDRVLPTCRLVGAGREFCNVVDTLNQIFPNALIGSCRNLRVRSWVSGVLSSTLAGIVHSSLSRWIPHSGECLNSFGLSSTANSAVPLGWLPVLHFRWQLRYSYLSPEINWPPGTRFFTAQMRSVSLRQSCRTTLRRDLLIRSPRSLRPYSMKPSFLNLFINRFTRDRVVPTISASVSCDIAGSTF